MKSHLPLLFPVARAYEAIVRATLEYAASIWDPYNTGKINQLEKVQRRAARFTTKNYTDRLVQESDGRRYASAGIATRLCWILNSKRRRVLTLLTWSGSTSARARAYEAIVCPTLEYAASIWDQYNTRKINKLEKVQRRAARFTTKKYTDR
jgi:hypothetical protein